MDMELRNLTNVPPDAAQPTSWRVDLEFLSKLSPQQRAALNLQVNAQEPCGPGG